MKTLEIIHLRLAGSSPRNLVDIIRGSVGSASEMTRIRIYRHSKLENDLAVHLSWETAASGDNASDVGIRLASLLKEHGMVSHSVWKECCHLEEFSPADQIASEREG